jgi:hypothetical protein
LSLYLTPLEFIWDFNRRAEVFFGLGFEFQPKLAVNALLFLSLSMCRLILCLFLVSFNVLSIFLYGAMTIDIMLARFHPSVQPTITSSRR